MCSHSKQAGFKYCQEEEHVLNSRPGKNLENNLRFKRPNLSPSVYRLDYVVSVVLALFPLLPLLNARCANPGTLPEAGHFDWFMEVSMSLAMERFDSLYSVVRWMKGCHLWKACINRNCLFYRPGFWSSIPLFSFVLVHFYVLWLFILPFPYFGWTSLFTWDSLLCRVGRIYQRILRFLDYFPDFFWWLFLSGFFFLSSGLFFSPEFVVVTSSWISFFFDGFRRKYSGVSWN